MNSTRHARTSEEPRDRTSRRLSLKIHPRAVAGGMEVCRRCGELNGSFIDPHDDRNDRVQKCACRAEPPGVLANWVWPGYAFNAAVELCFSCAAEVVHTGQLESHLFCPSCLSLVEARNALLADGEPDDARVVRSPIPTSRRMIEAAEEALDSQIRRSGVVQRNLLIGAMTRLKSRRRERVKAACDTHFAAAEVVPIEAFLAAQERVQRDTCLAFLDALFSIDAAGDPRSVDPEEDEAAPDSQQRIDRVVGVSIDTARITQRWR